MDGWIKLHRKVLDNPIACKDSDHLAVWNYLLLNATFQEYQTLFCGKRTILKPGQLITGRKVISQKFGISESKVQRILKSFESEHQIEQQTSSESRLITVISWEEYQSLEQQDEQQVNNDRTTSEQRVNTIYKNVKKNKKDKNVKEAPLASALTVDERKIAFGESLKAFADTYPRPLLVEFHNYWTEISENGKKMRFEKQDVFELSKRLAVWKRRDDEKFKAKSNAYKPGQFVQ